MKTEFLLLTIGPASGGPVLQPAGPGPPSLETEWPCGAEGLVPPSTLRKSGPAHFQTTALTFTLRNLKMETPVTHCILENLQILASYFQQNIQCCKSYDAMRHSQQSYYGVIPGGDRRVLASRAEPATAPMSVSSLGP